MKVAYKHLVKLLDEQPDINDLSLKLFQLGHEHEIVNNILDIEFTPNRGDCLSLLGLARDLSVFYSVLKILIKHCFFRFLWGVRIKIFKNTCF